MSKPPWQESGKGRQGDAGSVGQKRRQMQIVERAVFGQNRTSRTASAGLGHTLSLFNAEKQSRRRRKEGRRVMLCRLGELGDFALKRKAHARASDAHFAG
ncbi:MAG: hypothetical protein WD872_19030 [Pirellulaceae bacterium]